MDYLHDLLQELSSTLDTDSSGGESAGEEERKEDIVDEDDQAERAKLPQYASRFKVCETVFPVTTGDDGQHTAAFKKIIFHPISIIKVI